MVNKTKVSARLRATLKVANLVGIKYNFRKNKYGGFFTVLELEAIADKITALDGIG